MSQKRGQWGGKRPNTGGRREGAGRKPVASSPTSRHSVTLPDDLVEQLKTLGEGNLSRGIRRLAELNDPVGEVRGEK